MPKSPNKPLKVALLPASGIGDGLIMMIASNLFFQKGYEVTFCHPKLSELKEWFPYVSFLSSIPKEELALYDRIFVQNDNSPQMEFLKKVREEKKINLSIFYVTHTEKKHGPLHPLDFVSDLSTTIGDNLACCICDLLGIDNRSKETGMVIPPHLQKNRFPKRVVLHPSSGSPHKNWSRKKYLLLAQKLQKMGFEPVITVGPQEKEEWRSLVPSSIPFFCFSKLSDFAGFLYESSALIGNDSFAGHLSSYFSLPTLILAAEKKQMRLWQPTWRKAHLIFPFPYIPNFKGMRLLKNHWRFFVGVGSVLKIFSQALLKKA